MIVRGDVIGRILSGAMHELRLPVRQRHGRTVACPVRAGTVFNLHPGRGRSMAARIYVEGVRQEPLDQITEAAAQLEGFTRQGFIDHWTRRYGDADARLHMWVVTVRRLEPARPAFARG